jgi:hypothetical protein
LPRAYSALNLSNDMLCLGVRAELRDMDTPTLRDSIRDSSLWHATSRQPEHVWGGGWRFGLSATPVEQDAGKDLDEALAALLSAPETVRTRRWARRARRY